MNSIELLTIKSLKVLVRKSSNRTLISVSSIVVFCTLYLMWYLSRHQQLRFMSSDAYQKLQFNMKCTASDFEPSTVVTKRTKELQCVPDGDAVDRSTKGLTPSDLLFNKLSTGMLLTDDEETSQFAGLLSSLMMNGLPLLGLDDFVHFSDFVNAHLGSRVTTKILASPGYKDKFGNFLEVRGNHILLYPNNCWTRQFVSYLQSSSKVFKVLKYKIYASKKQAMRHCCRNVWAVLEIKPTLAIPNPSSPFYTFAADATSQPIEWKCAAFDPRRWNVTSSAYTLFTAIDTIRAHGSAISNESLDNTQSTFDPSLHLTNPEETSIEMSNVVPAVMIRMHPAAVPDTRNFEHSPINRHLNSRQQSGQLLYFTSGFLTLQLEVQNFLASWQLGGSVIQSDAFSGRNEKALLGPALAAHSLAEAIARATTRKEVYEAVMNATQTDDHESHSENEGGPGVRPSLSFPLFHRAFPTHNYKQSMFWHTFGALTSIGLIVYFSLPAAITAGELSRERATGLIDVLSTLPNVRGVHSTCAWCLCGACWVLLSTILSGFFFYAVLLHTPALLPALTLGLLGVVLCPMAAIIGTFVKNADTLVVAVPTVVFVTLLPGLLYFELAFDIQRSLYNELALCLLPASAAALLLRTVCGYEAINAGVTWTTRAAISNTPMYAYVLMLVLDVVLYSALCYAVAVQMERKPLVAVETDKEDGDDVSSGGKCGVCPSSLCCISSLYHYCASFHTSTVMPPSSSHAHLTAAQIEQTELQPLQPLQPVQSLPPRHTRRTSTTTNAAHSSSNPHVTTTASKNAALKVRSVTKQYASGASNVVVLSDINANLCENSVTLLLGSNGAGKTTLMKVLCGLDSNFTGQVSLQPSAEDPSFSSTSNNAMPVITTRAIGWCPQNDALFEHLTVEEHIVLFTNIINGRSNQSSMRSLFSSMTSTSHTSIQHHLANDTSLDAFVLSTLQKLDLVPHQHKAVCELSGGMKRRLSLCLAFLGHPRVLFLDEPTSGCDAWTRELVRKDILSRRGDCAILISTHHTDDIEILADRVWFLSERYLEVDEEVQHLAAWRSRELAKLQRAATGDMCNSAVQGQKEPHSASSGGLSGMSANSSNSSLLSTDDGKPSSNNDVNTAITANGGHAMEFSTCDERVKIAFIELFGAKRAHTWINTASTGTGDIAIANNDTLFQRKDNLSMSGPVCVTWIVPVDYLHKLRQLVATLETNDLTSWSLSTCSMYSTLCHLYDKDKHHHCADTSTETTPITTRTLAKKSRFAHLFAILWLRWLELYKRKVSFLLAQVLLPFIVVLCIALGCRDVKYPKTEISSAKVGGLGEMFFAQGETRGRNGGADLNGKYSNGRYHNKVGNGEKNVLTDKKRDFRGTKDSRESIAMDENASFTGTNEDATTPLLSTTSAATTTIDVDAIGTASFAATISNINITNPQHAALVQQYGSDAVTWSTARDSDTLWMALFDDYYAHESDRWAAFVMHDRIAQWLESTVTVAQSGLTVDIGSVFEEVQRAQKAVCSDNYNKYRNSSDIRDASRWAGNASDPSSFCGRMPAISVQIRNSTTVDPSNTNSESSLQYTNASIAITSYQSLHSNLTMLSNVTSDHAAPSYLKEVVPMVYSLLKNSPGGTSSSENNNTHILPINSTIPLPAYYLLYSHPLPLSNRSNQVYLARGYLGSTIVVLYMLMTTIVCVRTVIKLRRTGVKTQLHLASLHPATFWTANFLFDSVLVAVTLFAALGAIIVGGAPISNYFFEFPPLPGYLFGVCIVTFAMAVTASSYALVVQSVDQLSSQMLLLVSTVAGGMFLKLYLDRHAGEAPYQLFQSMLLWVSPAFTFSTAVFHMIATHARQVSASAQGKAGPNLDTLENSVYHCCGVMLLQAAVYLALCVCVDMYWYKLRAMVGRWRWYYSASNATPHKQSEVPSPSTIAEGGTDERRPLLPPSTPAATLSTRASNTSKGYGATNNFPSTSSAADIREPMQPAHPNSNEFGIFPHVRTSEYRSLVAASQFDIESSGDIELLTSETASLLPHHANQHMDSKDDNSLVRAKNLVVTYPGQTQLSLDHTTFHIAPSERVALMGMNGGGKSTLFRSLALAENIPVSGTLTITGLDSVDDVWQLSAESAVGYVPQEGGLLEFLTVEQSLRLFALLRPTRAAKCTYHNIYSAQDDIIPAKYYSYPISALSGGTRKKLAVQLANTNQPRLLLLDECTTGVDPIAAERIVRYLKHTHSSAAHDYSSPQHSQHQHQHQQGMLFASHRIDESLAVCSRVLMLVRGKVFLDGPISMFHDLAYRYYQVDITLPVLSVHADCDKEGRVFDDRDVGYSYQHDMSPASVESPSEETAPPSVINLPAQSTDESHVRMDRFLCMIAQSLLSSASKKSTEPFERHVIYSDTLVRITFQKCHVPISVVWEQLAHWQQAGVILTYAFRNMEMEEVLSSIIDAQQEQI